VPPGKGGILEVRESRSRTAADAAEGAEGAGETPALPGDAQALEATPRQNHLEKSTFGTSLAVPSALK